MLVIRTHARKDEPRLAELMFALDGEGAGIRKTNATHIERTFAHLAAAEANGACMVAEFEGRIVGYALLFPNYSAEYGGFVGVLDELDVEPEARGRGVGAELLARVEEEAQRRGYVATSLVAMTHNTRAQAFYERLGYERVRAVLLDKLFRREP